MYCTEYFSFVDCNKYIAIVKGPSAVRSSCGPAVLQLSRRSLLKIPARLRNVYHASRLLLFRNNHFKNVFHLVVARMPSYPFYMGLVCYTLSLYLLNRSENLAGPCAPP